MLHDLYVAPINRRARRVGADGPYLLRPGDNWRPVELPAFARTAPIGGGLGVLQDLLRERMFAGIAEVDAADIPWEDKDPRLVWRGATTGATTPVRGLPDRHGRFRIGAALAAARGRPFDLGYSQVTRGIARNPRLERLCTPLLREPLTIAEQLRARYLLALEGNDVGTGLRWMLHSASVVLMPHPYVSGFHGENLLEPMVHYVPVAPDLSDLPRVYDWCLANDERCRAIAANGRAFVAAFLDEAAEEALSRRLVAAYFARVALRPAPGAALPAGVL